LLCCRKPATEMCFCHEPHDWCFYQSTLFSFWWCLGLMIKITAKASKVKRHKVLDVTVTTPANHYQFETNMSCCELAWIFLANRNGAVNMKEKRYQNCHFNNVMVRSIINHATKRSACQWYWRVTSRITHKDILQVEMYRDIDVMFALSSGLCSWINKDSRIFSFRHLLSLQMNAGCVNESIQWSGCIFQLFSIISR